MNEGNTIAEAIHERMATAMARKVDEAITTAVNRHLGHMGWEPEDLRGRLRTATMSDKHEVYYLDDHAILRLGPWVFLPPFRLDATPTELSATRSVELLV